MSCLNRAAAFCLLSARLPLLSACGNNLLTGSVSLFPPDWAGIRQ